METAIWRIAAIPRWGRLAGLLASSLIVALLLLTPARAQETPQASPAQPTPGVAGDEPVIRIEIQAEKVPVPVGDIFQARVLVDNVDHLAGFDFTISYDPHKLRPIEAADTGATPQSTPDPNVSEGGKLVQVDEFAAFLEASDRGQVSEISGGLLCNDPVSQAGQVVASCSTLGLPLCLGGASGASGSGVLAVVPFESRGGGVTRLELSESTLVLDDFVPCDPEGGAVPIQHQREGASVELAPKDSSSMLIIVIVVVAVAVVVVAGGAVGYRWYRQRNT